MQWAGAKPNFYALIAAILNPQLSSTKALMKMGIQFPNSSDLEEPVETKKVEVKRNNINKVERPSREVLVELYKTMNQYEIADRFGTIQPVVNKWFKIYGISKFDKMPEITKGKLFELYVIKGLSIEGTAREIGTSKERVMKSLDTFNIPKRTQGRRFKLNEQSFLNWKVDQGSRA